MTTLRRHRPDRRPWRLVVGGPSGCDPKGHIDTCFAFGIGALACLAFVRAFVREGWAEGGVRVGTLSMGVMMEAFMYHTSLSVAGEVKRWRQR